MILEISRADRPDFAEFLTPAPTEFVMGTTSGAGGVNVRKDPTTIGSRE
jgi:hypothetical protein